MVAFNKTFATDFAFVILRVRVRFQMLDESFRCVVNFTADFAHVEYGLEVLRCMFH